jgi:hypothetical protein
MQKVVVVAKVNGRIYHRLRANTGSAAAAAETCARVSNCIVVR